MEVMINDRSKLIIKSLLNKGMLTLKSLKLICNVSERTISKDLDVIEDFIREYNLNLIRKPKLGIWIDGEDTDKERLLTSINADNTKVPDTPKERQNYILAKLIMNSNYITIKEISDEIFVSRGTLENDLNNVEETLKKNGLAIKKTGSKGIKVIGDEKNLRFIITNYFSQKTNAMSTNELIKYFSPQRETNEEKYNSTNEFFNFISDIDLKDLESLQGIISDSEKKLGFVFTDTSLNSLLIYIVTAIKRIKTNNEVSLKEEFLVNLEGSKEFQAASIICSSIEKIFNIKFTKSECVYISIQIMGAKIQYNFIDESNELFGKIEFQSSIKSLCEEMIEKASNILGVNFCNDNILLEGLCMHIRPSLNRLFYNIPINNPLLHSIKNNFMTSFEAAVVASHVIKKKYELNVDENEIAYIALHFEAAMERMKDINKMKKRIIIVCSLGIGTSQLLTSKLKRIFDNIEIADIVSSSNLKNRVFTDIDFILSTIPVNIKSIPVLIVNPLLPEDEIENIKKLVLQDNSIILNKNANSNVLLSLMDKDLMLINEDFSSKEEVIKELSSMMFKRGLVRENYFDTVIEREKIASTSTGRIALPHGDMNKVIRSVIGICTLKRKINWNEYHVDFVILLAINKEDVSKMGDVFDTFYDIISNNDILNEIVNCDDKVKLISLFTK